MNPKKKSRRCRASVSIQALDLAISRFIHSLGRERVEEPKLNCLSEPELELRIAAPAPFYLPQA
jgi:hypothetical protein